MFKWLAKLCAGSRYRDDYEIARDIWLQAIAKTKQDKSTGTLHTLKLLQQATLVTKGEASAWFFITYSISDGPVRNKIVHVGYVENENRSNLEILFEHVAQMMNLHFGEFVLHNWSRLPRATPEAANIVDHIDTLISATERCRDSDV